MEKGQRYTHNTHVHVRVCECVYTRPRETEWDGKRECYGTVRQETGASDKAEDAA